MIAWLFVLFFSRCVFAEEMDQFTDRLFMLEKLPEALADETLNVRMQELISKFAQTCSDACSPHQREKSATQVFQHPLGLARDLVTPYANWIVRDTPVPLFFPRRGRGIYGGAVNYSDMLMAWYVRLAPILKANGVLQGTDKMGHFIGQGWQYYLHFRQLQKNFPALQESRLLQDVREYGDEMEAHKLGLGTGGVFSPADLASNWQGFVFFRQLLEFDTKDSYIFAGKLRRKFRWQEYITDDWDEVINPSAVVSEEFFRKVASNFRKSSGGEPSICSVYNADPQKFLHATGRRLPSSEYMVKPKVAKLYWLDVRSICYQ